MKKKKKNCISIKKEFIIQRVLILTIISISILLLNIFLYNKDFYLKFIEISTLGVLWTIIGFAFTVYCFIISKLAKTINNLNKFEKCIDMELYCSIVGRKHYLKIKRIEMFQNSLKYLIFFTLSFLVVLTLIVLSTNINNNILHIIIALLSNLILTESSLIYFILIYLSLNEFDATNILEEDVLKKLEKTVENLGKLKRDIKKEFKTDEEEKDNG